MKYMKRAAVVVAVWLLLCMGGVSAFADITPHDPDNTGGYDDGTGGYDDGTGGYDDGTGGYDDGTGGYDDGTGSYDDGTGAGTTEEESTPKPTATPTIAPQPTPDLDTVGAAANTGNTAAGAEVAENYVVIGKLGTAENTISSNLNLIGIGLIALGAVGIVCVIVWSWAAGRASKSPDEEVYEAVGMADARNRAGSPDSRSVRQQGPAQYRDSYSVDSRPEGRPPQNARRQASQQTLDPVPAAPPRQEERIVPQSSRGGAAPRHAQGTAGRTGSAAPRRQAEGQQNARPAQQRPAQNPAARQPQRQAQPPARGAQPPRRNTAYNTDEIMREALRKRDL